VFYLDIAYVLIWFQVFFASVSSVFFYMLQVLHLDISKVDLVLHMLLWLYAHVLSVLFFFRRMLQAFHLDFSKVDLREAHTAASVPP
jgi:hypothetical protein